MLSKISGYSESRKTQLERLNSTKQGSLRRALPKCLVLITMTHGHLWQNSDQSIFLLATAAQHGWPINMFDFHSAFLNGQLDSDEEVFMEQPQGYEESDKTRYVCKLFKSLYEPKQAGRKWYDALCKALADIGFN